MHHTYIIENEMFEHANSHFKWLTHENINIYLTNFYSNIILYNLIIYIYSSLIHELRKTFIYENVVLYTGHSCSDRSDHRKPAGKAGAKEHVPFQRPLHPSCTEI